MLARKEDGYAIDPRNNFKNIEAIGLDDVVITDGNGTVVSIKKLQDEKSEENDQQEDDKARRRRSSDQENKLEAVRSNFEILMETD